MTIETLKTFIEHAPAAQQISTGPAAWVVDDGIICASCADRIMRRGCSLGNPKAIWADHGSVKCDLCGKGDK